MAEKVNRPIWQKIKKVFDTTIETQIAHAFKEVDEKSLADYNKYGIYRILNDEKIIIKTESKGGAYYMGGFIIILSIVFYFIIQETLLSPFLALIGVLFFIYGYTIPLKEIILDRKNQLITLPGNYYGKSYTFPFSEAHAFWSSIVGGGGAQFLLGVRKRGTTMGYIVNSHISDNHEMWSFYVWYMDKNRPLPPGNAFDPYREKDFQRRKAEGFPLPLHKSYIRTTEATPEQQKEREQYWTDDHYTEEFVREAGSEKYHPSTHKGWEEVQCFKNNRPLANAWREITFSDGKVIYTKTDEHGTCMMPPDRRSYEVAEVVFK